jgi:hypothetical protein
MPVFREQNKRVRDDSNDHLEAALLRVNGGGYLKALLSFPPHNPGPRIGDSDSEGEKATHAARLPLFF